VEPGPIEQHGRMALGGEKHVPKPAEHVRPDCLTLVGAGHAADLVGGDAEMIRPEPDEPLDETNIGVERGIDAGVDLLEVELLASPPSVLAMAPRPRS
jgi:hypothetical protein